MDEYISVRGAKEHNLKDINVDIPKNKMVIVTGISGSGKSSLAFDTIFAEGQRRYVQSLSAYARQFLQLQNKPNVESITGLSPSIAIDQKTTSRNPRSTVGTITEIYDYLRLLFARIGLPYSPVTGDPIKSQSISEMVDRVLSLPENTKVIILAPIAKGLKGEFRKELLSLEKKGFARVMIDEEMYDLSTLPKLDKNIKHNISVVVDRIVVSATEKSRITDSIETSLKISDGIIELDIMESPLNQDTQNKDRIVLSSKYSCPVSGFQISEIEPRIFSFNSPFGACQSCEGLGKKMFFDTNLIIENPNISIREGAIAPWKENTSKTFFDTLEALAKTYNFSLDKPYQTLPEHIKHILLFGTGSESINIVYTENYKKNILSKPFAGIIPTMEDRYKISDSLIQEKLNKYRSEQICSSCKGYRLHKESLCIKIDGLHIGKIVNYTIDKMLGWVNNLPNILNATEKQISDKILKEINSRLNFLNNVGLGYLTLSRESTTLSGGENQRIRLASQIGSGLTGVLYVLDEPSIGLHQRDNLKLIETLKTLKSMGNTVLIVEHDEETILESDYIIDIGPGAGVHGGNLIAKGTVEEIKNNPESITGLYLSGKKKISPPKDLKNPTNKYLELFGASLHNLKNINVKIPLGQFVVVTGVSGSGKSTLVLNTIYPSIQKLLEPNSKIQLPKYKAIKGVENIDKVIHIDQSPIGRTPRSNPATYIGVFSFIRSWYTNLPESRIRGYKIGRFSFNVKGGRCEACQGDGLIRIEMHFLPDVFVKCDTCKGSRYNRETLEILYQGKSIADILEMTVENALDFFSSIPDIYKKIHTLQEVGLGYIKLGQSATTLSGGEAQRVKLAKELSKRATGKTIYILDEPTTGLHFEDINKLLNVLHKLAALGNSLIIIEHNMDIIKTADHIIDIGPEGGKYGGRIVATGNPKEIAENKNSITGKFLKKYL